MQSGRKGIRGNNRISKALNKPINGPLAKNVSMKAKFVVLLIAFLAILYFSIRQLGYKAGIFFAVAFSLFVVVAYFMSERQRKTAEKITKKHPWKAFDDKRN